MGNTTRIPTNKNFLSPLGFDFSIYKTPNMNYFVQTANIPGITMGTSNIGSPFNTLRYSGDKITYNEVNVTIRVDEEMRNYYELYSWIKGLSHDTNFNGYAALSRAAAGSGQGLYSDAVLTVLSSAKTPILKVNFVNLFPIMLSDIMFNSMDTSVDYIDVMATFAYERFDIEYLI